MKKNNFVIIVSAIFLIAGVVYADETPLRIHCNKFDDTWFTTMRFLNDYCYPGTWGNIPVTRADAEFGAALNIGLIGKNELVAKTDEQFKSGGNIPFGTRRTEGDMEEEFVSVSLGDFAVKKSSNAWEAVLDYNNNGKLLGHRQNALITYLIRQGRCYATFGVSGEGPMESRLYYGVVAGHAEKEAKHITETMKGIEVCGRTDSKTKTPVEQNNPTISNNTPISISDPKEKSSTIFEIPLEEYRKGVNKISEQIEKMNECRELPDFYTCSQEELEDMLRYLDGDALDPWPMFGLIGGVNEEDKNDSITSKTTPKEKTKNLTSIYTEKELRLLDRFDKAWEKLDKESELISKTKVFIVDSENSVEIDLLPEGGSEIKIKPGSVVEVTPEGRIGIFQGSVEVEAEGNGEYEIKIVTPVSATVSKHTRYTVSYDAIKKEAVTEVHEGEVEVFDLHGNKTVLSDSSGNPRAITVSFDEFDTVSSNWLWIWLIPAIILLFGGYALYKKGKSTS